MSIEVWLVFTDNGQYEAPSLCSIHATQTDAITAGFELQRQGYTVIVEGWEVKSVRTQSS